MCHLNALLWYCMTSYPASHFNLWNGVHKKPFIECTKLWTFWFAGKTLNTLWGVSSSRNGKLRNDKNLLQRNTKRKQKQKKYSRQLFYNITWCNMKKKCAFLHLHTPSGNTFKTNSITPQTTTNDMSYRRFKVHTV